MATGGNSHKPTSRGARNDTFKRAVTVTMRAIARAPDLEVTFASDRPALAGAKARLPEPPRRMSGRDAAVTRGIGDSMALRLACHDAAVHRTLSPEGRDARGIFDAIEQARCDAVGSRRMSGVADNLGAMLEDRYYRGNFHEITDRADAPLEDALALIVRERLTGAAPPESARHLVDLWRPWVEERAGGDLDGLAQTVEDQRNFGIQIRDVLAQLELAEELASDQTDEGSLYGVASELQLREPLRWWPICFTYKFCESMADLLYE
jgi:cobaltochelatase CobT